MEGRAGIVRSPVCIDAELARFRSWNWFLIEKLTVTQPVKKFPAFDGTRRLFAVFNSAHNCTIFRGGLIQSACSDPVYLKKLPLYFVADDFFFLHLMLPTYILYLERGQAVKSPHA
jgi:hypothetical protein